ncbi:MAG: NHL repeat-containing protein [Thermomicrobiales bacterium]
MDDTVFDHLTRVLVTRRAGLGLGLGALAGLAGIADAKKKKKNKNKKKKKCKPACAECTSCKNGKCQPVADGAACGAGDTCQNGVCAGSGGCGKGQKRCGAACIARDACCQDGEVCGDGTGRCLTGVCRAKPVCESKGTVIPQASANGRVCCSSNVSSQAGTTGVEDHCLAADPGDTCLSDSDCATGTCVGYRCRSCAGAACGPTYRFEWDHAWPGIGTTPVADLRQLAVNSAGHALTVDLEQHRLVEMAPDGSFVRQIGVTGSPGSAKDRFNSPRGVAVDANDNIYVADAGNDRVQKFAPDGTWLLSGGDSQVFNFPGYLAFDSKQQLYVADVLNRRVLVFKTDGTFVRAIPLVSTSDVQGVGVDHRDHVFTKDPTGWWEYDANGTYVSKWAVDAYPPIAFSPENTIFVVEPWGDGHTEAVEYTAGRQFVRSINPSSFPGAVADQYFSVASVAFDAAGNLYISGDSGIDDGRPYVQNYRLVKFAVVPYAAASAGRKASGGKQSRKHKAKRHHQKK